MTLSEKVRAAYDRCKTIAPERHNSDGTVTIGGQAFIGLLELRQLALDIETALREQEQNVTDRRTVRRNSVAPPPADRA